jgi:hypothetical protein
MGETHASNGIDGGHRRLANANERDERRSAPTPRATTNFELEIDPELDARFGPRPVNAVRAAAIIANAFPGARVTEAEGSVTRTVFLAFG